MVHPATIALIILGTVILLGATIAEDSGIWNDETITDTITQDNTSYHVCMGDVCDASAQVSVSYNMSINGSWVCTQNNGWCAGQPAQGNGSTDSLAIWQNGTYLYSDPNLYWNDTGNTLTVLGDGANNIQEWKDSTGWTLGYISKEGSLRLNESNKCHAIGWGASCNTAQNNNIAIGYNALSTLHFSTAIGYNAQSTSGQRNVAILGTVSATDSISIGGAASGGEDIAIGGTSSGLRAIAIDGTASGTNAVNIGYAGSVSGDYSHSVGMRGIVTGDYSQAFGKFLYNLGKENNTLLGQGISHGDRLLATGKNRVEMGMDSVMRFQLLQDQTIFLTDDATDTGLVVRGAAAQSANLQEWQDNGETVLSVVDENGHFGIGTAAESGKWIDMGEAPPSASGTTYGTWYYPTITQTGTHTGTYNYLTANSASGVSSLVGAQNVGYYSGAGTATSIYGGVNYAWVGSGTATVMSALNNYARTWGTATVGEMDGISGGIYAGGGATITQASALEAEIDVTTGATSITEANGINFEDWSNIGTVTESATMRWDDSTRIGTTAYGIYGVGGGNHLEAGTSTVIPLTLKGAAAQSANLQEWQNVTGDVQANIEDNGDFEQDGRVSIGTGSTYSGTDPVVVGVGSTATNDYAVAVGSSVDVSGLWAVGIGVNADCNGQQGVCIGNDADTAATRGVSIGRSTDSAASSVAIGDATQSMGGTSTAVGFAANAAALDSVAIGRRAYGGHLRTTAIGYSSTARHLNSIALGYQATTTQANQVKFGNLSANITTYFQGAYSSTVPIIGLMSNDTGIGSNGDDNISFITGNVEAVRITDNQELLLLTSVEEDLRFPATVLKTTGASNIPDFEAFIDGTYTFMYDASTMEQSFVSTQMPHSWEEGGNIYPHFHWSPTDANGGNVTWCIECTTANIDGTFGSTITNCVQDEASGTAYDHLITNEIELDFSSYTASSMMLVRIYRNATSANDTYASDAALLEFDIHYQVNKLGQNI